MSIEAVDCITVRMYRHGFGDCFLLQFYHHDKRVFAMLIDCGIKHNTTSKDAPIEEVIEDLKTTLTPEDGTAPVIDVLVATHEHWDHVAFFHPTTSPDFFKDFDIKQLWLPGPKTQPIRKPKRSTRDCAKELLRWPLEPVAYRRLSLKRPPNSKVLVAKER